MFTLTGRGLTALVLTILFWGSAFPGIRAALRHFTPDELGVLRFSVASLALAVIAVRRRPKPPALKDWPGLLALGIVGIGGYNLFLNSGSRTVTAGVASLLINTAPIWTALVASVALRERPSWNVWLGLAVAFCGAGVIALRAGGGLSINHGAALVLGASVCHCAYILLQKRFIPTYGALGATSYAVWIGTAALLILAPRSYAALGRVEPGAIGVVVYLGLFPAALAYVGWGLVLKELPASRASAFLFLVPVSAFIIAWLWLGESASWRAVVGGALVFAGVALVNRRRKEPIVHSAEPS